MSDGGGCMTESLPSAIVLKWKDTNQTEGTSTLKDDMLQLCIVGAHAMTLAGCILSMLPLLPNTLLSLGKV